MRFKEFCFWSPIVPVSEHKYARPYESCQNIWGQAPPIYAPWQRVPDTSCAMTHSCVCHDSFMCVPWLTYECATTHSDVWHDALIEMCALWGLVPIHLLNTGVTAVTCCAVTSCAVIVRPWCSRPKGLTTRNNRKQVQVVSTHEWVSFMCSAMWKPVPNKSLKWSVPTILAWPFWCLGS